MSHSADVILFYPSLLFIFPDRTKYIIIAWNIGKRQKHSMKCKLQETPIVPDRWSDLGKDLPEETAESDDTAIHSVYMTAKKVCDRCIVFSLNNETLGQWACEIM